MKTYIKIILAIFLMTAFNSCTLDVQDNFEFVPETYITEDPFKDITAWEFIQSRRATSPRDSQGRFTLLSNTSVFGANGDELDFFAAAIKKVGFEGYYNQTATTARTYLLLNNNAFTGTNAPSVILICTGKALADNSLVNPDTYFDTWTPAQLNTLKAILKYHIVSEYVAQRPTISTHSVNFLFKTLLPLLDLSDPAIPVLSAEMSDVSFFRSISQTSQLLLNEATAPLPVTATTTGWNESVRRHNYVFNNGLGHFINEPIRYQPYELYTNIPIN